MNPMTPDLNAIEATADLNVQFYAAIGAATSLAAEMEAELFRLYHSATGLSPEAASDLFHRSVAFKHKRDLAAAAVREAAPEALRDEWAATVEDISKLGGQGTARNLIGHNPAHCTVHTRLNGDGVDVFVNIFVEQNPHQVSSGRRPQQRASYPALMDYCRDTVMCVNRIRRFGYLLREARGPLT